MIELKPCECGGELFVSPENGDYYGITCLGCLATTGSTVLAAKQFPQCSQTIIDKVRQEWNSGIRHPEKAKIVDLPEVSN